MSVWAYNHGRTLKVLPRYCQYLLCFHVSVNQAPACFEKPKVRVLSLFSTSSTVLKACCQPHLAVHVPAHGNVIMATVRCRAYHQSTLPPFCRRMVVGGFCWALLGFSLKELLGGDEELQKKTKEEEEVSPLVLMIKRGALAFHLGEYDKSESLLHVALRTAQDLEDENAVTYIYDVLANLALQRGRHDTAEKLFKSVLQRHVADGGDPYGNVFVAVSLKIAQCYAALDQIESAVTGYHYCITAQKRKLELADDPSDEDTLVLYAMSVEQYGRLLLRLRRYDLARQHLQEALYVCRQVHGEDHLQSAVLRNDIGTAYSMERRYAEAAAEIEDAVAIARACLVAEASDVDDETPRKVGPIPAASRGDPRSSLVTFLTNLGSVRLLNGSTAGARRCCQEAALLAQQCPDQEGKKEAASCLKAVRDAVERERLEREAAVAAAAK